MMPRPRPHRATGGESRVVPNSPGPFGARRHQETLRPSAWAAKPPLNKRRAAIHALQCAHRHKENRQRAGPSLRAKNLLLSPLMNTFHSKPLKTPGRLPAPQAGARGPTGHSPPVRAPAAVSACAAEISASGPSEPGPLPERVAPDAPLSALLPPSLHSTSPNPCGKSEQPSPASNCRKKPRPGLAPAAKQPVKNRRFPAWSPLALR